MGRVAREQDPPGPEAVREARARPEAGGPAQLRDVLGAQVRVRGHQHADAVQGQVGFGALREAGLQLEVVRAGERAQGDAGAVGSRERVPVAAVQAGQPYVRNQERRGVDRLAGHADADRAPDHRVSAVRRHDVPRAGGRTVGEPHGHALGVLSQAGHPAPEGNRAARLHQPRVQHLLRAPLRDHPRLGERRALVRLDLLEHRLFADPLAVLPDHPRRIGTARRPDRLQYAQVVEDFQGAGLDPLAAGAGEQGPRPLHHQSVHAPAGEVDAEGQAGGARAHDQDIHRESP
ncbi:hypothetical protein BFF78_16630 [Streptomyces fodineus]|uniref:Uncharacterized protein n=1 Tax=Streptomyces fodineus TaxID=1904616 RepID=A0A1D7YAE5_9ACTN|nr:hypothetical protein BFF78_16630 [Streptomyces fodineus]